MIKTALFSLLLVPLLAFGQEIRTLDFTIQTDPLIVDSLYFGSDTVAGYTVTLDSIEFTDSTNFLVCRATINGTDSTDGLIGYDGTFVVFHDSGTVTGLTVSAGVSPSQGDTIFLSDSIYIADASNKDTFNNVIFRAREFTNAVAGVQVWGNFHAWGAKSGTAKITHATVTKVIDSTRIIVSVDASADTNGTTATKMQFGWYAGSATAYADNDLIGFPFSISLGGDWAVVGATIIDSADQSAAVDLMIYDTLATPDDFDNAAFNIPYAEGRKTMGLVTIGTAGVQETDFGRRDMAPATLPVPIIGDQHLTGILLSAGTPTYTGSRLFLRLVLEERIR